MLEFAFDMSYPAQIARRAQLLRYGLEYLDKHGPGPRPSWMPWGAKADNELFLPANWSVECECPGVEVQIGPVGNTVTAAFCPSQRCHPAYVNGLDYDPYVGTGYTQRFGYFGNIRPSGNPEEPLCTHAKTVIWQTDPPSRFDPDETPWPEIRPGKQPYYPPVEIPFLPMVPPEALPIQQPVAPPAKPVPWPMIPAKPITNPGYKTDEPTKPAPAPWQPPYTEPGPGQEYTPPPDDETKPDTGPEPGPDPDPKPTPEPGTGGALTPVTGHPLHPPGRREKERKTGNWPPYVREIVNGVSEGVDFVDAAYDALGKKCKGANTPQAKLRCLYQNIDTLDMDEFVQNLVENEVEDRAWGAIGGLNRRASKRAFPGLRRGFQTGPLF